MNTLSNCSSSTGIIPGGSDAANSNVIIILWGRGGAIKLPIWRHFGAQVVPRLEWHSNFIGLGHIQGYRLCRLIENGGRYSKLKWTISHQWKP